MGNQGSTGPQGATGPKGDVGTTGSTGSAGSNGTNGTNATITPTPTVSTRTLNSTFQPNTTKHTLCIYTIKTSTTNPLLVGTSTASVVLFSDAATTPTIERCRVEASSGVGLTVTVALTTSNTAVLTYMVPAGHYVKLTSTITGTGTATIVSQTEITLG